MMRPSCMRGAYSRSQRSTMPTTHASVGVSAGRNGKDASRPRTKNTCSPTPAPTASSATSVRPAACRSGMIGCKIRSLWPVSAGSLSVETTSPTTRAICMIRPCLLSSLLAGPHPRSRALRRSQTRYPRAGRGRSSILHVHLIHDAHDRGVDRAIFHAGRHSRGAAADNQDGLAESGVDGIHGDEVVAFGLAGRRIDRTDDEQLVADEPLIFSGCDNRADDFGEDQA